MSAKIWPKTAADARARSDNADLEISIDLWNPTGLANSKRSAKLLSECTVEDCLVKCGRCDC